MTTAKGEIEGAEALVAPYAGPIKQHLSDPDGAAIRHLGIWFAGILLTNTSGDFRVEDYGFDRSTFGFVTDSPFGLELYDTVGEFLDHELTGQTNATYQAESGFATGTYAEQACEVASAYFHDYICLSYPALRSADGRIDDWAFDALYDAGATDMILIEQFVAMPLTTIYARYLTDAIALRNRV